MKKQYYPIYYKGSPRLYVKSIPIFWWVHKWVHFRFIFRELTSVPVAYFVAIMILYLRSISLGEAAYLQFVEKLQSPVMVSLNIIALIMVIYHSITWFNLTPKAIVIRLGEKQVPGFLIAGINYVGWLVLSGGIVWLLLK